MRYLLEFPEPHNQQFRVTAFLRSNGKKEMEIFISKWRPGRYELADYASLISQVGVTNEKGNTLPFRKTGTHSWLVESEGSDEVVFQYDFYANRIDAGSSFLDPNLVYVNGINLLVFSPELIHEEASLECNFPPDFRVACSLPFSNGCFRAPDFHDLADSPILASPNLVQHSFPIGGIKFHVWFRSDCEINPETLTKNFPSFLKTQINMFGDCPVSEFHFLFILTESAFYHGVEHHASTAIVIGPCGELADESSLIYREFLGISSHEFFHTWNVKAIRPLELLPYDYQKENFTGLHYVTEGITTYYGDLMLLRSGTWDLDEWMSVFNDSNLARLYRGEGWKHMSLEQASFESWNTGYREGVPNRKISFYTKGAVVAFMLDIKIRSHSGEKFSLDDVMRELYQSFARQQRGYTAADFKQLCEKFAGRSLQSFFDEYISGTKDVRTELREMSDLLGLKTGEKGFDQWSLTSAGYQTAGGALNPVVIFVWEGSPAEKSGLRKDDQILEINHRSAAEFQFGKIEFDEEKEICLNCISRGIFAERRISIDENWRGTYPALLANPAANGEKLERRKNWISQVTKPILI